MAVVERTPLPDPRQRGAKPQERVMNGNITLGRFGGVDVRINWSWLVIFALIVQRNFVRGLTLGAIK